MKAILAIFTLFTLVNAAQADQKCADDLKLFENQKEIFQTHRDSAIEDLKEATALIRSNKLSKAKPLLFGGISTLKAIISEAKVISFDILDRTGQCPRQLGFMLIARKKIEEIKRESEVDLDLAEQLRKKFY